jgi:hypothetical protein
MAGTEVCGRSFPAVETAGLKYEAFTFSHFHILYCLFTCYPDTIKQHGKSKGNFSGIIHLT